MPLLYTTLRAKIGTMSKMTKARGELDKKYHKVLKTPAGFAFFVAIHDFIEHIELNKTLSKNLSERLKANRDLNIPVKYNHLKLIYQGLEDAEDKSNLDLGHTRYAVLLELDKIRNNNVTESNSFWKKRETYRKLTAEIYNRLVPSEA